MTGSQAGPPDVTRLLADLAGDILADPNPLTRYRRLTAWQEVLDSLVSVVKRERGRALAELSPGRSNTEVAELVGLGTRQRVEQLIAAGRTRI